MTRRRSDPREATLLKILKDESISIRTAAKQVGMDRGAAGALVRRDRISRGLAPTRPHSIPQDRHPKLPLLERLVFEEGRTQAQAAYLTGLTARHVSKILNAAHGPAWRLRSKRAKALRQATLILEELADNIEFAWLTFGSPREVQEHLAGLRRQIRILDASLRTLEKIPQAPAPSRPRTSPEGTDHGQP